MLTYSKGQTSQPWKRAWQASESRPRARALQQARMRCEGFSWRVLLVLKPLECNKSNMRIHWNVPRPKFLWPMKSSIPKCVFFFAFLGFHWGSLGWWISSEFHPGVGNGWNLSHSCQMNRFLVGYQFELKRISLQVLYFTQVCGSFWFTSQILSSSRSFKKPRKICLFFCPRLW